MPLGRGYVFVARPLPMSSVAAGLDRAETTVADDTAGMDELEQLLLVNSPSE